MSIFRPTLVASFVSAALVTSTPLYAHSNATLSALPNYSAPSSSASISKLASTSQKRLAEQATRSGNKSHYDASLNRATFLWAGTNQRVPDMSLVQPELRNEYAASHYLNSITGLSTEKSALNRANMRYVHDLGRGAKIAKYQQEVQGIEVFNKEYNIMMDQEFNLVASSGYFANKVSQKEVLQLLSGFGSPEAAVERAVEDISRGQMQVNLSRTNTKGKYQYFDAQSSHADLMLLREPRTKRVFYELNGKLTAAFYVELLMGSASTHDDVGHSYVIESATGKILLRNNLMSHLNDFTYRLYAETDGTPFEGPHGDVIPKLSNDEPDTSEYVDMNLVTLSHHSSISTGDPWLPADATVTAGNNVIAYADIVPPNELNEGDVQPSVTSANTFDYQYNPDEDVDTVNNLSAAAVNMFFMNNYFHNWWYDYGFDEVSFNAQADNYGRGGEEGDPLEAQAQDYSGLNNANMFTPADGSSPRMQQFAYTSKDAVNGVDQGLTITSHDDIGLLDVLQLSSFGPLEYELVSGEVVRVQDGNDTDSGSVTDGCEAPTNADELVGKIAIVDRGSCNFTVKVFNAQEAGAIGTIIANNNDDGTPAPMGGADANVTIPNVGINFADGARIYEKLEAGDTVTAEFFSNFPLKDSSFDNGIIAHEWGHYIQNRLIGNGSGLINFQGRAMGEGWSDFHALMFLVKDGDADLAGNENYSGNYGGGTFVEDFFNGIRRAPYSTDMEINPFTFQHIESGAAPEGFAGTNVGSPHAPGEIWGTALWEVYVALLNAHPFAEAEARMARYLVAGYKMTPISPTYTEARDAQLAAILASSQSDYELALAAFAKRGLGFGAISPDRDSTDLTGVVESFETQLTAYSAGSLELDADFNGVEVGFCSNDGYLDQGETGTIRFTVSNAGSESLSGVQAQIEVVSDQDVTIENEGLVTLPDIGLFESVSSGPIQITLNEAGTAENLEIQVSFPEMVVDDDIVEPPSISITELANIGFEKIALTGNSQTSDMETLAVLGDWSENIISVGDNLDAEGTRSIDTGLAGFFAGFNPSEDFGAQMMYIANNPFPSDVGVETDSFTVADSGTFNISFWHFYAIEATWDGGVVEVSVDGGDWMDVTEAGGTFSVGYTGELQFNLPGRMTYTGLNGDLATTAGNVETIDFGEALNGSEVKFRFRIVTDESANDFGWWIDNVTFNNITTSVISEVVAGNAQLACDNAAPVASFGSQFPVVEGKPGTIEANITDRNGDSNFTYMWIQTDGPEMASLSGTDTAVLTFVAPPIAADTTATFQLTVSDGESSSSSSVTVTLLNEITPASEAPEAPTRVGGSAGSFGWTSLLLLPLVWLRRRASK